MTDDPALLGAFANRLSTRILARVLFVMMTAANLRLVRQTFSGN
ncbi:hypothetical protein [Paraburkholderia ferrariae]|nr:hypothetical protein [Paraburkholderia ferrariae]